ncbi:hypothetical protein C1646_667757, partial [Rhizophagus diaphanus]
MPGRKFNQLLYCIKRLNLCSAPSQHFYFLYKNDTLLQAISEREYNSHILTPLLRNVTMPLAKSQNIVSSNIIFFYITSRINKNSLNLFANIPGDFWLYSSDLWVFKGDFMARINTNRNSFFPYES